MACGCGGPRPLGLLPLAQQRLAGSGVSPLEVTLRRGRRYEIRTDGPVRVRAGSGDVQAFDTPVDVYAPLSFTADVDKCVIATATSAAVVVVVLQEVE